MGQDVSQADLGADLRQIHRILTRAFESVATSARALADGDTSRGDLEGFCRYMESLLTVLHHHHQVEDTKVFPDFQARGLKGPYGDLSAQHHAMHPHEKAFRQAVAALRNGENTQATAETLATHAESLLTMWRGHIETEQEHFNSDAIDGVMSKQEQADLAAWLHKDAQKHGTPAPRVLPFMLYNMTPEERGWIGDHLPWFVKKLLIGWLWKGQWQPMVPFMPYGPKV